MVAVPIARLQCQYQPRLQCFLRSSQSLPPPLLATDRPKRAPPPPPSTSPRVEPRQPRPPPPPYARLPNSRTAAHGRVCGEEEEQQPCNRPPRTKNRSGPPAIVHTPLAVTMAPPTPPSPSDPLISAVSPTRPWAWTPPSHADTLQLVQVHYYIRHGERTPVRTRMTEANPPIPARWDLCHIGKQFRASVLAEGGRREEIPLRKGVEAVDRRDGSVVKHLDGECLSGELTDLGRLSTFTLGQYLRSIYVDRFQLLPSSMQATSDADKLYVRSTNMSRTMESAQQVLRGLLGSEGGADANGAAYMPKILFR